MEDLKIDNFQIGFDEDKEYICVKNPLQNDTIKDLYENEYHKDKKVHKINISPWEEINFNDKFSIFEENLENNSSKSLLDIGCGTGRFLLYGKNRAWKVKGVEPSRQACECAKFNNLDVINDIFSKKLFEEKSFDVIHLHHVLEHLETPSEVIADSKEILKDDGILCVVVPNDFSPFQKTVWKELNYKPWWVVPEHHINYFSFDSLSKLLYKNGFEVFLKETSFPLELFLLFGENYVEDENIGRKAHEKRVHFDRTLSRFDNNLRRKLYQSFANLDIGRDIILYANKRV